MMERTLWSFEAAVLLALLSSTDIYGTDVTINSLSDCGRTYHLNDHSEVNIQFYQKSSYEDCEITIKEHSSDDYPRMCIKPKRLDFNGCTLKVQVHMGLVIDGYEDEEYTCSNRIGVESCTYLSTITVIFKRRSSWRELPVNILLRVYPGESEFKAVDTPFTILMGVIGGVCGLLFIIVTISVCCCRAARQRAIFRQRDAMPSLGVYPQVQYSTVPPQTGGFQPPPPQWYQPPPQGYQPSPLQGFQAPSPQGYQPPPQGYQSPSQGYQPPPRGHQPLLPHGSQPPAGGYQPPVAHGYQPSSQDYGKHSGTGGDQSDDAQKESSAPPRPDEDIPPPPYPDRGKCSEDFCEEQKRLPQGSV